ncbi:hypothetical protein AAT19DRAFT_14664 [Rhodotorula toruloides]|uniref:Uncharacterized protein n=1 Tax=Rhodotorula toruloides TaxID=5286 RepID=A0A2T0A8E9_RHOTO|nr:hypothetical protein AAT19DRAFT_14664 [Rhodotorula toruloides]
MVGSVFFSLERSLSHPSSIRSQASRLYRLRRDTVSCQPCRTRRKRETRNGGDVNEHLFLAFHWPHLSQSLPVQLRVRGPDASHTLAQLKRLLSPKGGPHPVLDAPRAILDRKLTDPTATTTHVEYAVDIALERSDSRLKTQEADIPLSNKPLVRLSDRPLSHASPLQSVTVLALTPEAVIVDCILSLHRLANIDIGAILFTAKQAELVLKHGFEMDSSKRTKSFVFTVKTYFKEVTIPNEVFTHTDLRTEGVEAAAKYEYGLLQTAERYYKPESVRPLAGEKPDVVLGSLRKSYSSLVYGLDLRLRQLHYPNEFALAKSAFDPAHRSSACPPVILPSRF